jgi:hypothetical protein
MPSQYTEKANATLVVTCASCKKQVSTAQGESVGLPIRKPTGIRQVVPVCCACYAAGWRPQGHTGF